MDLIIKEIDRLKIEDKIKENLYIKNTKDFSIEWGMNYIVFSSSKRARPLLLLESNLIFSELDNDSFLLSSALELIHTYSLVHDDLPCMDNDDLRRGVKTLHKVKNEAYAVLVGDALLTRAFGILSRYSKTEQISEILKLFYEKSGERGMIYGQFLDIEGEGKKLEIDEVNEINVHKTGCLLQLTLILGAINGNAKKDQIEIMDKLGFYIGHIFQLRDDILDIVGNKNEMGKNTGSDKKNCKSSVPLLIGIDKTVKLISEYKNEAIELINKLPSNKVFFSNFLEYLINRKK